jgi:hypothetical protein
MCLSALRARSIIIIVINMTVLDVIVERLDKNEFMTSAAVPSNSVINFFTDKRQHHSYLVVGGAATK